MATRKKSTAKNRRIAPKKRKNRGKKQKKRRFRILKWLFLTVLVCGLLGVGAIAGVFWWYSRDLPNLHTVEDYHPKQVTRVVDREGRVLAAWTDKERLVRTVVPPDKIPDIMRQAIISAEDGDFYKHGGLDFVGLLRAIYINVRRGELSQGASTITQQVVKNLVLSPQRTIRRKVQEAILSWKLDNQLSKDDILNIYLNAVFFGVHFYGVEEASLYYFGHSADTLDLQEAALLAGLVQSPNGYNPYRHPDRALQRRHYVLQRMYKEGYINEGRYHEALESPLGLIDPKTRRPWEGKAGYYVDAVRRIVQDHLDVDDLRTGGYRIVAAVDVHAQQAALHALRKDLRDFDARHGYHMPYHVCKNADEVKKWRKTHANDIKTEGLDPKTDYRAVIIRSDKDATVMAIGPYLVTLSRTPKSRMRPDNDKSWETYFPPHAVFTVRPVRAYAPEALSTSDPSSTIVRLLPSAQGAAVAIDVETRDVLALVGGYSFAQSKFNRAVQARRQTGSTFKVFVYSAALNARKLTPGTIMQDQPMTVRMPGGKSWQPRNYNGSYAGPMSVRKALARSVNVVAVRALQLIGVSALRDYLKELGYTRDIPDSLTVALGSAQLSPLDMTSLVATFPGGGKRGDPVFVLDVQDSDGHSIWKQKANIEPAVDPRVAWLTESLMRSVVTEGTGGRARKLPFQVAGKTGTTNKQRDGWFTGYSTDVAATVWVGYDNNHPMGRGETGSRAALPAWVSMMKAIAKDNKPADFAPPPDGIVTRTIDAESGLLAPPGEKGRTEYYLSGTEPRAYAIREGDSDVTRTLLNGGASTPAPQNAAPQNTAPGALPH